MKRLSGRVTDQKRDPERNLEEETKAMQQKTQKLNQIKKYKDNFEIDTGFEYKCCCCLQFKGVNTCYLADKLNEEEHELYLLKEEELTQSKDGLYYVCIYCYQKIRRGSMDKLKDKPIQIVEDIPENMKQMLINNCQFKDIALSDKERFGKSRMSEKSLYPNRLEQHLLKKILPFMRFGHCPRGPFLQASPFFTNIFGSTPCHYSCAELFAQALLSLCPILRKLKIYLCQY